MRRGAAQLGFPERLDAILNWAEFSYKAILFSKQTYFL